jgi:hypothetical protein
MTMPEQIDPALARKLDAFAVPGLPAGFAERMVAAAQATPATPPLPRLRKAAPRRWWRAGASGLAVVAAGMISVAAAASGYFGEPIRHAVERAPVIGAVIERVAPSPRPRPALVAARRVAPVVIEAPQPAASLAPELPPRLERRAARLERLEQRLANNPRAQQWVADHPVAAARIVRRAALRDSRLRAPELRAERILARQRWRAEHGLAPLAGPLVPPGTELAPGALRGERLRRLRERRLQRLEAMRGGEAAPEVTPQD